MKQILGISTLERRVKSLESTISEVKQSSKNKESARQRAVDDDKEEILKVLRKRCQHLK